MYKTRLQELCHEKRWSLPRYSSMKDGPDHNPRFKSSVSVNGLSFHSSVNAKSRKHSQNDAAMLAFLHFTTTSPPPPPPPSSSIPNAEPTTGGSKIEETSRLPEIYSEASDMQCQFKSQLQNYARRENLESPLNPNIREGPAHAPCFKATVTVDGHTFESPDFFTNLKQAEHAAAKVTLMSSPFNGFQEDDSGFYKNLLQEFCQRDDLSMPVYKTIKSGAPHMPTFFSTVEVEGEVFYGKAGKSKKEAEIKAAKVAYTALIKSGQSQSIEFSNSSPSVEVDETSISTSITDLAVTIDSENLKQKCQLSSSLVAKHADDGADEILPINHEVQAAHSAETQAVNAKPSSDDSSPSPVIPCIDELIGNQDSLSSFHVPTSSDRCSFSSPPMTHPNVSPLSISDSRVGKATETRSYLLCNRVRFYPCIPDIAFPKGITVLPISSNKWVAVSLEFPNETN